jgi:hypothetical protein
MGRFVSGASVSEQQGSKTNRPRHSLLPETLAASGFYGIEAQEMQPGGLQFSIKIPTIKYTEKYSSGRRGVTRKQTDLVTVYFLGPLQHLAFTKLKRRECKRLLYSFLSKFRQLNNTEKYSSGERADRRRWRMKEGERVAAVKIWRSEQRATNFGHRNRIEEATPIR